MKKFKFISRHGFLTRDVIIVAILFTGIIALLILAMGSMATSYNRPDLINSQFSNNFNKLQQVTSGLNDSRNQLTGGNGISFLGNFDVALSSMWTTLNLVWNSIDLFGNMGSNISSNFTFIPPAVIIIVSTILISILMVIVIFTILSSVTRGRI